MRKFISSAAQQTIEKGVQLFPTIDRVSDLDMKCDAVRSISALNVNWGGDDDDYTLLYDSGHGMLKKLYISKETFYEMLPSLANFHNLEYLAYNADEKSRLFISQWPKSLRAVEIGRTEMERPTPNLAALNDLPNLRALVLRMRDVKLESLLGLADRLQVLAFGKAVDMENISHFTKLETLNYGEHTGGMEPFGALENLKTLCIEHLHHDTLDGLEGCKELERLRIQSNALAHIGALHKLEKLKVLQLPCPQVEDISGLAGSPIEILQLNNSSVLDFSPLADMPEIQELLLAHTLFEDTTVLAGMKKLTKLNLEDTLIEDLSPLVNLENLEQLDITHCKGVKDLSPVYELKKLTTIRADLGTVHRTLFKLTAPERIRKLLKSTGF